MAGPYPNLGFDPCPGNLRGYQALADYAGRSATTLVTAVQTLASANSQDWRGQAADAFRTHVHQEVMPLARKASDSVAAAATALRTWAATLAGLQDEARALDRQAAPYRDELDTLLRSAGLPAGSTPPYPGTVKPVQRVRLDQANGALSAILAKANDLHTRYLADVQRVQGQLDDAGNMAPHPPGLFASLWHDAAAGYDSAVHGLSDFVHDKGLWEFVSGVCNVIAAAAGLLALFPPLTAIFGPIALIAAGIAMGADVVLAGSDRGNWAAVAMDAVAVVSDAGWIKAAGKLADLYREAGLEKSMTEAPTWAGMVSKIPIMGKATGGAAKSIDVAPGMFRMIGDSLKAATGGTSATVKELNAIEDLGSYDTWRAVDIVAGQASWSFSGAGIEAIPGNVRDWVNQVAAGKTPWQESAASATGLT
jgi:hypothetical protein